IIFMVNGRGEFSSDDFKAAELLRLQSNKKPVLLVANKCDHPVTEVELAHMYELGLGEPYAISAIHKTGVDHLIGDVIKALKDRHFLTKKSEQYKKIKEFDQSHLNISLVGKTNVGKSSLINALSNQEKLIVSETPHTTRDSTDTLIRHEGVDYNFIDTAGMRRPGKITKGIEYFSVLRTISSIERSDISLLVIDSSQEITHQDQQIANTILKANKGLVILANKWDIKDEEDGEEKGEKRMSPEEKRRHKFVRQLQRKFPFLSWAPVIFTSAVTKKNLSLIFDQLEIIKEERNKRISTAKLNHFIDETSEKHKPSGTKSVYPKLFYVTQVDVDPPRFVFFVNKKKYFHFSYLRYLENRMREQFGFTGTPLVLEFKEKEQRYGKK
ncbi:ribosome biogenesis GTPase Der, partial [Candidatus Pacearchaeota archaeon]|nr:ribosome biogenesis GTPase Der [Candidatus Pacearchaeota archaeon]